MSSTSGHRIVDHACKLKLPLELSGRRASLVRLLGWLGLAHVFGLFCLRSSLLPRPPVQQWPLCVCALFTAFLFHFLAVR